MSLSDKIYYISAANLDTGEKGKIPRLSVDDLKQAIQEFKLWLLTQNPNEAIGDLPIFSRIDKIFGEELCN